MYIAKDSHGKTVKEFSDELIKPGIILYLRNYHSVTVLDRRDDYIIFSYYNGKIYKGSLRENIHRYMFFEGYDCALKYCDESGQVLDDYEDGYAFKGYDKNGFNQLGYDKDGYNFDGFDKDGYNRSGRDRAGRDREGYDSTGFNALGYDKDGIFWKERAKGLADNERKRIFRYLCTNEGIILTCQMCGEKFFVTFKTLEFLEDKDYDIPKRCKNCRKTKDKYFKSKGKYYGTKESFCRDNFKYNFQDGIYMKLK